jgi:hypothetical protein
MSSVLYDSRILLHIVHYKIQFTFTELNKIQHACSLYVTSYTKTMLLARWLEKVTMDCWLSAVTHLIYEPTLCHSFLYIHNTICEELIKLVQGLIRLQNWSY